MASAALAGAETTEPQPEPVVDQAWEARHAGDTCLHSPEFTRTPGHTFFPTALEVQLQPRPGLLTDVEIVHEGTNTVDPRGPLLRLQVLTDRDGAPGDVLTEGWPSFARSTPDDVYSRGTRVRLALPQHVEVQQGQRLWVRLQGAAADRTCLRIVTGQSASTSQTAFVVVAGIRRQFGPSDSVRLRTFRLPPAPTRMRAEPWLAPGTVVSGSTSPFAYRATLSLAAGTTDQASTPVPRQTVVFSSGGESRCTAVTDAQGLAQCQGLPPGPAGVTATFAGTGRFAPSDDQAPALG